MSNSDAHDLPIELRALAARIRLLVLDADGVLTDGRLYYGDDGEVVKAFHARDGLGLRLLRNEGVQLAVISGRAAPALERRVRDLRVHHALLGRDDKRAALDECLLAAGVLAEETAFVGDDVLDLPAMRAVGLGVAVADAHARVRHEARWVTNAPGGRGAVREVADGLLKARGRLDAAIDELLREHVGRGESLQ
ncbi:MAG: HAD hydrolase family protein [Sandaracinaceae bacterium]|nr:HAD hydrolase family protein [Sandaracinaceae bacterium]